jgi:predicted transcriptional regulator of viral defense system
MLRVEKFGLATGGEIWVAAGGRTRVQLSDPARTVVDMLANPALADGVRPAAEVLKVFLREHGTSAPALVDYGDRLENGAMFKRLGFLLEAEGLGQTDLVVACRKRWRSSYVKLDPSIPVPRLVTVWGLWVPKRWVAERSRD